MPKLYELDEPKEGWEYWRRYLTNGIHFKVDAAGLSVLLGSEAARELVKGASKFAAAEDALYMRYTEIYRRAGEFGILPELMVDEEYYMVTAGCAPYRLAFEALRKGMTVWDVYVAVVEACDRKLVPRSVMEFIRGKRDARRRMTIGTFIDMCRIVGIEPGDVFRPRARVVQRRTTLFDRIREALAVLSDRDVAAAAAVITAFANAGDDDDELLETFRRILAWRREGRHEGRREGRREGGEAGEAGEVDEVDEVVRAG